MCVAGYDKRRVDAGERGPEPLRGREPGQDLVVAAGAGVTEQDAVELQGQRQLGEYARLGIAELGGGQRSGPSRQIVVAGR